MSGTPWQCLPFKPTADEPIATAASRAPTHMPKGVDVYTCGSSLAYVSSFTLRCVLASNFVVCVGEDGGGEGEGSQTACRQL